MRKITYEDKTYNVYTVETEFGTYEVILVPCSYQTGGNLAIRMLCVEGTFVTEPFTTLTVNIGMPLDEGYAYVDTNNNPWAEKFIKKNRLGKDLGMSCSSGYCVYPLYKFDLKKINE